MVGHILRMAQDPVQRNVLDEICCYCCGSVVGQTVGNCCELHFSPVY